MAANQKKYFTISRGTATSEFFVFQIWRLCESSFLSGQCSTPNQLLICSSLSTCQLSIFLPPHSHTDPHPRNKYWWWQHEQSERKHLDNPPRPAICRVQSVPANHTNTAASFICWLAPIFVTSRKVWTSQNIHPWWPQMVAYQLRLLVLSWFILWFTTVSRIGSLSTAFPIGSMYGIFTYMKTIKINHSWIGTPPKFNIAPEKWWLEDYFPIGKVTFQGLC